MAAPLTTGIPAVDAELERRGPFADAAEAEAVAAKLLTVWRALYPSSSGVVLHEPSQRRQQRR
jgi:hypothetical protein